MALEHWRDFFVGELGAAAALAGLLFVIVSVNQSHILELGSMADRGMEALLILLLTLIVASLGLVPEQSLRLLGGEIASISILMLTGTAALQRVSSESPAQSSRTESGAGSRHNKSSERSLD